MTQPLNPPAFPFNQVIHDDFGSHEPGMTLRDYFAGQALAGIMAQGVGVGQGPERIAELAFLAATAMLAERAKGGAV